MMTALARMPIEAGMMKLRKLAEAREKGVGG
jgi:hypothetical protein